MMDGISAMDTGNNGQMLQMNIESIGEVKILTQGYQAEYGRSSGLQITAVTKSGSNQFRGSAYDIETNSDWNENSWVNDKNGDPKPKTKHEDAGLHHRRADRQARRQQQAVLLLRARISPGDTGHQQRQPDPHSRADGAERAGDFSQTRDNNGALFNLIKDPNVDPPCTAANTAGCFQAGGVLGRIPGRSSLSDRHCVAQPLSAAERRAGCRHELQLRSCSRRRPRT